MSDEQPLELPKPKPKTTHLGALLQEWELDALAAHQAALSGIPRGPITGLRKVDEALGGAFQVGLHFVHGTPGAGKTAFALQVAGVNAADPRPEALCPVLFVSCEMGTLELFRRVVARVTGTYLGRLKSGELHPSESLDLARTTAGTVPNLHLCDATNAPAATEYLRGLAEMKRGDAPRFLLVVDSLHSWAEGWSAEGASEMDYLPLAVSELRRLAQVIQCPILAIVERNRASMNSEGQSAGAGSRKIEYGAETVISLGAEERETVDGEVKVKLTFPKNRNGAKGKTVDLLFSGREQRFREA
jgi:replicative DNA helicase